MLGWRPVMLSWLNTLPKTINEDMKDLIRDLFDRMITPLLDFVRKGGFKVLFYCLQNFIMLPKLHVFFRPP